ERMKLQQVPDAHSFRVVGIEYAPRALEEGVRACEALRRGQLGELAQPELSGFDERSFRESRIDEVNTELVDGAGARIHEPADEGGEKQPHACEDERTHGTQTPRREEEHDERGHS